MSEWSQSFTLTKNVARGFILCSTPPTQRTTWQPHWRCLLRVLCPVRSPVTALDCVLLKDRNLALAPRQGPSVTRTRWGESVSQFYELGWLLAVLNMIHSLAVQAGICSKVLEAVAMPTTTLIVCLLRTSCNATCYVGESAKLALLLLRLSVPNN